MALRGYIPKYKKALWTQQMPVQQADLVRVVGGRVLGRRIAPMSSKRRTERRQYMKLRRSFLIEHPTCQRPGCGAKSVCVHHWAGRRSNYLKVETWRASCNACNDYAKNNPKAARAENWIAPIGIYKV